MKQATTMKPTATKQSLAARPMSKEMASVSSATFKDTSGADVTLSIDVIKNYICPGQNVTDSEAVTFLNLCKYRGLNPFTREVYLIKFNGNVQTVVGVDTFKKRAQRNPKFQGMESGVIVITEDGVIERREGEFYLDSDELVGAWCSVYVKDYVKPITATVNFSEYCQKRSDGSPMGNWATKPATMIHKVAMSHALRDAFSDDMSGMYEPAEMGVSDNLSEAPIVPPESPAAGDRKKKPEPVDADYTPVENAVSDIPVGDDDIGSGFFDD